MKKAKQTLTAALAATLATGVVGSVANAAPVDELYATAFKAMQKAQTEKTQAAVNEARIAINALPKELDWAKGEFSKQVDAVQQPIFEKIVATAVKAEATQAEVNEARALVKDLSAADEAYKSTWSSALDTLQGKLITKTTEAVKTAKSQKAEDIKAAETLVAELKTSTNEDTKKEAEKLEATLIANVNVYAVKAEAMNASTVEVTFSKELEKEAIDKTDFTLVKGQQKVFVKEVTVSEDKKTATLTLSSNLKDKEEYTLTVDGLKDSKGNKGNKADLTVKYEKQEIGKVEFKSTNVLRNADLKKDGYLTIKDTADRDITKEAKVKFVCVEDKNVISRDGKISGTAKLNKEYTVRILDGSDTVVAEQTIKVVNKLDVTYLGFTLTEVDSKAKFADITPTTRIKLGTTREITIFYLDAVGKEQKVSGKDAKVTLVDKGIVTIVGDHKIKAHKEGTAVIKVVYGGMEQEIEVEATKEYVTDFEVEIGDVVLADVDLWVPFDLKKDNNLSGKIDADLVRGLDVKIYNERTDKWHLANSYVDSEGTLWLNGRNLPKGRSEARLELPKHAGWESVNFNIDVEEPGKIADYVVEAREYNPSNANEIRTPLADTIDFKEEDKEIGKASSIIFRAFAIDDKGNRVKEVKTDIYEIDGERSRNFGNVVNVDNMFKKDGSVTFKVLFEKVNGGFEYDKGYGASDITLTIENSRDKTKAYTVRSEYFVEDGAILKDVVKFWLGNYYDNTDVEKTATRIYGHYNDRFNNRGDEVEISQDTILKLKAGDQETVHEITITRVEVAGAFYDVNTSVEIHVGAKTTNSDVETLKKEIAKLESEISKYNTDLKIYNADVVLAEKAQENAQKAVDAAVVAVNNAKNAYDVEAAKNTTGSIVDITKLEQLKDAWTKAEEVKTATDTKLAEAKKAAIDARTKVQDTDHLLDRAIKDLAQAKDELAVLEKK